MTSLLLTLLVLQSPMDEGTLVVREDTVEIAREAFRLTAVRTGAGPTQRQPSILPSTKAAALAAASSRYACMSRSSQAILLRA